MQSREDWANWVASECKQRGWTHNGESPLVWREIVDTGGKGLYLGGLKEFEEYASHYHSIHATTTTELEDKIAAENESTLEQQQLNEQNKIPEPVERVCLTDATSPIAYHLAKQIVTGVVFGKQQRVAIHLYHREASGSPCDGLALELQDLASPLLDYIRVTTSLKEAFDSVSLVFLLDYAYNANNLKKFALESIKEHEEQLVDAAILYQTYANTLDFAACKNVKVVVSGYFANTGTALVAANVSSLPPSSIVAAPCLAESQARAIIAQRLQMNPSDVFHLIVWGRTHGAVQVDLWSTRVCHFPGAVMGPDPFNLPITRCEFDIEWLEKEFPRLVTAKHTHLEGYGEEGPSLAEAVSLAHFSHTWVSGANHKWEWQSVGVISDGDGSAYQVPEGLACSLPCCLNNGKWEPVPNLNQNKVRTFLAITIMIINNCFSRIILQVKLCS